MSLIFRELDPQDALWAAPLLQNTNRMGCEFSYTTAYMWSRHYDVRIAQFDGGLLLCSGQGDAASFLPPIGLSLRDGVELLRSEGLPLRFHGVDKDVLDELCESYPNQVRFAAHAEDFDYIYNTIDLATLPGRAYHSKKNHIAAFSRQHEWRYEPLTDENISDVLAVSAQWCSEKGSCADAGLSSEQCAIRRLLKHREILSVTGGVIYVGDKAVAFTLGSPINSNVYDVHVEKALSAYSGAYAVINREFAKTLTNYRYLNRENDMGIPGLRRAKESYRPVILLKKYTCEIV